MYKVYNSRMSAQKLYKISVTIAINCEMLTSLMNVSCILGYKKISSNFFSVSCLCSVTTEFVYLKWN
jgi:hypothetical protein